MFAYVTNHKNLLLMQIYFYFLVLLWFLCAGGPEPKLCRLSGLILMLMLKWRIVLKSVTLVCLNKNSYFIDYLFLSLISQRELIFFSTLFLFLLFSFNKCGLTDLINLIMSRD